MFSSQDSFQFALEQVKEELEDNDQDYYQYYYDNSRPEPPT